MNITNAYKITAITGILGLSIYSSSQLSNLFGAFNLGTGGYHVDKKCFVKGIENFKFPKTSDHAKLESTVIGIRISTNGQVKKFTPNTNLISEIKTIIDTRGSTNNDLNNKIKVSVSKISESSKNSAYLSKIPDNSPDNTRKSNLSSQVNYYTKISFVLLDEGWSFDENTAFEILNMPKGVNWLHPFYEEKLTNAGRAVGSKEDPRVLTFTYFSHPNLFKGEDGNRKCKYAFNLNVHATHEVTDENSKIHEFSTPMIVDPIIQNDGSP